MMRGFRLLLPAWIAVNVGLHTIAMAGVADGSAGAVASPIEIVYYDAVAYGGQFLTVSVLREKGVRGRSRLAWPLQVWMGPSTNGLPDMTRSRCVGQLDQQLELPDMYGMICGCVHADRYVFVYQVDAESGAFLATNSIPLAVATNAAKSAGEFILNRRPLLPYWLPLRWADGLGDGQGQDLYNARPLRLFVGADGCLNLVGLDVSGPERNRLFFTRLTKDGWEKCRRYDRK